MKLMKYTAIAVAALGLMTFAPDVSAATTTTTTVVTKGAPMPRHSGMTRAFIVKATIGNGYEIMAGRLALQRSQNPEIRDFAQRMIDDHSRADEDLRNTIMSSRFRMMNMPNDIDGPHRAMLSRLENAQGPMFDRLYVNQQIKAHHDAVALFSNYGRNGHNPALRQFASNTLPTLQEHQQHIRQIRFYR